jgi:hypothetical protein
MNVLYRVEPQPGRRDELKAFLSAGKHPVRKLKRVQILMPADAGTTDEKVAIGVGVGGSTVYRTKRRFVLGNRAAALSEEPRPGGPAGSCRAKSRPCWWPPPVRDRTTEPPICSSSLTAHRPW